MYHSKVSFGERMQCASSEDGAKEEIMRKDYNTFIVEI